MVSAVQSQTAIQHHLFLVGVVGVNTEEAGSSVITDDAEVHHVERALQKKKQVGYFLASFCGGLPQHMSEKVCKFWNETCNYTCACTHTHAHARTHARAQMHACTHTHTHMHARTHTHT